MASMLGKRKRETIKVSKKQVEAENSQEAIGSDSEELDVQEIFRRHFEARYAPLPIAPKKVKAVEQTAEENSEEASDWDGISNAEDGGVQVIEHTEAQSRMAAMSKEELKSFMVNTSHSLFKHV